MGKLDGESLRIYNAVKQVPKGKPKLLTKNAYGLDQKGEVVDGQPLNIEDTSTGLSQHKTPINLGNSITDVDAKLEFPGLGDHMHRFPARGRT